MWPHPTVDEYVLFQVVSSTKWITTLWTFVYFLLSVDDHVLPQVSCSAKWHLTFWASVGLHSTVGEHVPFQISYLAKWLLTFWTIVWPFSSAVTHTHHLSGFGWRGYEQSAQWWLSNWKTQIFFFTAHWLWFGWKIIVTFTFQCLCWTFYWEWSGAVPDNRKWRW